MILLYIVARDNVMHAANVFHTPLPFYATQIIDSFLNSMISAHHDKVGEHSANGEILIKGFETQ